MTVSQKRAIGYAIREKVNEKRTEILHENRWREEFYKSGYKTVGGFLKSKGIDVFYYSGRVIVREVSR